MSNDSSPSGNLYIKVRGGTGAADAPEGEEGIEPRRGKVEEIVEYQVSAETKSLYNNIIVEDEEPFIDSADAVASSMVASVNNTREHFRRRNANLIDLSGSDTSPYQVHCQTDGISPDQLGNACIINVVAMDPSPKRPAGAIGPIDQRGSDAASNIENAIYLSTRPEMRGRIGFFQGLHKLLVPRGLRKDTFQVFGNRYREIALSNRAQIPDWNFLKPSNASLPTGIGDRFGLCSSVESLDLTPLANYQNIRRYIQVCLEADSMNGLVLEVPGSRNIRQNAEDRAALLSAAELGASNGVPVVVTGEPMEKHYERNGGIRRYKGAISFFGSDKIIDGGPLTSIEARVLTSQALYRVHKLGAKGQEVIDYVRLALENYLAFTTDHMDQESYMRTKET